MEAVFLNRVIKLRGDSSAKMRECIIEPDTRHVASLVNDLGMEKSKGLDCPSEKRSVDRQIADSRLPLLDASGKAQYRSLVMRAAYLAQDRPDIGETTKGLARHMNEPTEGDWGRLKRLARYLKKHQNLVRVFREQRQPKTLRVFVDTDHAGCALTRKSTTGLAVRWGQHCIKHASNLQSTVSLSLSLIHI